MERLVQTPPREEGESILKQDGASESPPGAKSRDASFPSHLSSGGGGEGRHPYNGEGGGDGGEERWGSDVDVGDDAGAVEASESAVDYVDGRTLREAEPPRNEKVLKYPIPVIQKFVAKYYVQTQMSNGHAGRTMGADELTPLPIPSMKVTPPLPSPLPLGGLDTPPHRSAGFGAAGGLPQPRGKATLLPLTAL